MTVAGTGRRPLRRAPGPHRMLVNDALRAAFALLEAGRVEDARQLFEQIRLSAPEHPTALTMLSVVHFRLGEKALGEAYLQQAIETYERHLEKAPRDPGLLAPLVNLLLAAGRETEAEQRSRQLELELNPIRATAEEFCRAWRHAKARRLPLLLLVTVPKSASETIWNRLARGLGLPQTHLSLGLFPHCCLIGSRLRQATAGGMTSKEHILPTRHNLEMLQSYGIDHLIVHLRDPRQAVLSWTHFVIDDVSRRRMGAIWRSTVPPRSVLDGGFASVLDWSIEHVLPRYVDFARRWATLADGPSGRLRVRLLSYERFLEDPDGYVDEVLEHFSIPERLYDRRAAAAAASVHLRKGRRDEWRDVFTRRQRQRADALLDAELCARFGWNKDPLSRRSSHVHPV